MMSKSSVGAFSTDEATLSLNQYHGQIVVFAVITVRGSQLFA
jgi:hypothetical protein